MPIKKSLILYHYNLVKIKKIKNNKVIEKIIIQIYQKNIYTYQTITGSIKII